jgi:hypothetical protein
VPLSAAFIEKMGIPMHVRTACNYETEIKAWLSKVKSKFGSYTWIAKE